MEVCKATAVVDGETIKCNCEESEKNTCETRFYKQIVEQQQKIDPTFKGKSINCLSDLTNLGVKNIQKCKMTQAWTTNDSGENKPEYCNV